jgi:nicotinamidase-related amidase
VTGRTVLLALHYQNEVLHPDGRIRLGLAEGATERASVVAAARRLLAGARAAGIPVIHVRIAFPPGHRGVIANAPIFRNVIRLGAAEEGSWGAEFHDGLGPLADEAVVTHGRINAFYETDLEDCLRRIGATRLILGGVATNSVVEHTARHAVDMGYEVVLAADACSASRPDLHRAAIENIALLGEISTVAALFPEEA